MHGGMESRRERNSFSEKRNIGMSSVLDTRQRNTNLGVVVTLETAIAEMQGLVIALNVLG